MKQVFAVFCLVVLGACAGNDEERTIRDNHAIASTQIESLRTTATVQTARIAITIDYLGTEVSLRTTQSQFLQATLVERGTPEALVEEFKRSALANIIPMNAQPQGENANNAPAPTSPPVTLLAPIAPPPATDIPANAPRLENVVTSTGVGADDCANNVTNTFTTNTPEIYVVAVAVNVPRHTAIASRWFLRNQQVLRFEFTPNFDIARACIWFYIDQNDIRFEAGAWSVVLDFNNTPAIAPVTFTMVER